MTRRHEIKVGSMAKNSMGWLMSVEEVWLDDANCLWAKGHVVSRPLMAETLLRGETHPVMFWKVG